MGEKFARNTVTRAITTIATSSGRSSDSGFPSGPCGVSCSLSLPIIADNTCVRGDTIDRCHSQIEVPFARGEHWISRSDGSSHWYSITNTYVLVGEDI